jgi:hypothetical protein
VGDFLRMYTVGASGAWMSTVHKQKFDTTLPYPNAPALDREVHILPLEDGYDVHLNPECEVYATPLHKYKVQIMPHDDAGLYAVESSINNNESAHHDTHAQLIPQESYAIWYMVGSLSVVVVLACSGFRCLCKMTPKKKCLNTNNHVFHSTTGDHNPIH